MIMIIIESKQLVLLVFSLILSVLAQKPDVDCNEMVARSGKSYNEIYVPHESDCNQFYQCTAHGLEELECLKGLVFFPYINGNYKHIYSTFNCLSFKINKCYIGCILRTKENCITWDQWKSQRNH
jgi:Chitin binding Peritrophin-A domain